MKNYSEMLAKGSFFVFVMYFLGTISGYIMRLFLARNLSLADYGLFYALLAFTSIFILFRDLGLSTTIVKFIAEFNAKNMLEESKSVFLTGLYIQLLIGAAIMLPVMVFAGPISTTYFKTADARPLFILAVTFVVSILFSVQYLFQGLGKIRHYSIIEPLRNFLTLIFAVLLISFGVIGIAISYLAAAVAALSIAFWYLLKIFPLFKLKSKITAAGTNRLLHFSFPVFLGALAGTFLSYADTLLLTYFRPLKEVALYNAALPTSQLLWVAVGSLSIVLLPVASELWAKNDRTTLSKIVYIAIKISFASIMPLIIILLAFPEIFLRLFFGEAYVPAAAALQILALNAAFYTLFTISTTVLFGIGRPKTNMWIYIIIAIVNLSANVLLIPPLGIVGAAASIAAAYLLGTAISLFCLERNLKVKMPLSSMVKTFFGGASTLLVIFFLKTVLSLNPWVEFIASASSGLVFYLLFIFISGAIGKDDIRLLSRINVRAPKFLLSFIGKLAK